MSYIILTRNPNPRSKRLVVIQVGADSDDDPPIAEYRTYEEATRAANDIPICKAWGFEVVGVTG